MSKKFSSKLQRLYRRMNYELKDKALDEIRCGQIVRSKAGRDKGRHFIVYEVEGEYINLVDGSLRKIENPKKKKLKHIQKVNIYVEDFEKLKNHKDFNNALVRKILNSYEKKENS